MSTNNIVLEFVWDKGNSDKNYLKHNVTNKEAEDVFFDRNCKTFNDIVHSINETRYRIIGKTEQNRILLVIYTIRGNMIRVISARDTNKKEIKLYEKKANTT